MMILHVMDAPLTVALLSAFLVCSWSLPTKRDSDGGHDGAVVSRVGAARAAEKKSPTSGGLARPAGTDASSVEWLDSYRKRSAPDMSWRWDGGRVPYVIDSGVPQDKVLLAMQHWHDRTCIRFVPRTNETVYIRITMGSACNAMIGRILYLVRPQYQGQLVTLTPSCANVTGNIIHELGHVVGLYHEQCRPDRDQYVRIIVGNVITSLQPDFNINPNIDTSYGPYDLGSIMHYALNANSINRSNTMELKVAYEGVVGQREGLSSLDISKIGRMYGCPVVATPQPSTPPSASSSSVTTTPFTPSGSNNFSSDLLSGAQPTSISPSPSISTESSGSLGPPFLETISSSGTILPSWTIVSLGTTPSQGTTSSVTIVPTTSDPISSTPVPTMSSNSMTAVDPDTLVSGSNIGLKLLFTPNSNFYWIGCTATSCVVKNCPGNRFKPEKIALCPEYIFIISRTDGGSVIRVGDTVSLTQQGGGALYCGLSNPACLLSPNCKDSSGRFSTQLCANQVLVIRALNKVPGQPIMNNDNVVLDFFIGSLPVSGWMDNLNCHSEANGSCDRRYCLDNSVLLQAGNTTLTTISPCRQLFTIFKLS